MNDTTALSPALRYYAANGAALFPIPARRKQITVPTSIYWLVDVRPEILRTHPDGLPFYCGKTMLPLEKRFKTHISSARARPERPVSIRVKECEGFVTIRLIETVPADEDWRSRERHWIRQSREMFEGFTNVSDGGDGVPGFIHTNDTRKRISSARKGMKFSPEHCAAISRAKRNISEETRAKFIGNVPSVETRAKMRAAKLGKPLSASARQKLSVANKGKTISAEARAKSSATQKGRKFSDEHRERIGAAQRGKKRGPRSPETRAKISASHLKRQARKQAEVAQNA